MLSFDFLGQAGEKATLIFFFLPENGACRVRSKTFEKSGRRKFAFHIELITFDAIQI